MIVPDSPINTYFPAKLDTFCTFGIARTSLREILGYVPAGQKNGVKTLSSFINGVGCVSIFVL